MIFSVPKFFLFLNLGITFAVVDVPGSKRHLARFEESGLTSNSTTHGRVHSLGEVRSIKEGAATASDPAAHGHCYTPGMNRLAFAHPTESTPDSTTESKILAARITTIETITVTSSPLVFKTVTITRPYSQSSPAPPPLASTIVAAPEVSDLPEYRSITIMLTQQPTVPPPSETLTGPPITLPSCNDPAAASDLTPLGCTMAGSVIPEPTRTYPWTDSSQGSLWHLHAAATSQPPPWTGNSTPCAANESFECVVNGSSIITLGPISQILATGAQPTSGTGISGNGVYSQSWTSNSTPCAQNKSFECVVEGSSTITLGLISEILGAATGKPTSGVPVSSSGNHSQNWTSHSTPCVDNKSFECVDTGSGIITLGPIASLNHLRPWTADSSPCVQNKSFECVVNGSSTITLGLIASLTASQPSTMSTNKGLLSTLSAVESLLTTFPTPASTTSTKIPIVVSVTSGTSSWGEIPQSAASSMMSGLSPCTSNTSLECLGQGTSTFVVGTLGLPLPTPTPLSRTLVPCAQNTILSCFVDGSHTLTVPILPSTTNLAPCAQDTLSSCVVEGSHTSTVPPRPSNHTISSNFPTASGTQNPHDPYPYPRASNGIRKFKIPTFLVLLCSLVSIVTPQGFHGRSNGADPPSTSTSINYGPLVSSLNDIASSATNEPDGNWGIGAPPATTPTSTPSQNPSYGGGTASIATGFIAPQNPTFAGAGGEKTTAAASTHADSGSGSSASLEFPSSFIVPVTGSGTEAPVETSSQAPASSTMLVTTTSAPPTPSKSTTSGSSKIKIPSFLLLLSHLASLALAVGTTNPSSRVLIGSVFTSASASSPTSFCSCIQSKSTMTVTSETMASSFQQASSLTLSGISRCSLNTNFECMVAGTSTSTVGTVSPPQTTLMTTIPPPTTAGASPSATSKTATSGASNIKIPILLLLFCTLVSLASAASAPGLLSLSETTSFSASWTSGYSVTPTKSTTFTITAAQTETTPSSGSTGVSTAPSAPTPNPPTVCSSNADLMCIVQGSSTSTVGTLQSQSTLTTTSAMVAATTGILTAAPSTPAKSGGSPNCKLPIFLSFLGTLLSLMKSAAASDFPIPSDYAGAGNMKVVVHREMANDFPIPSDYAGAGNMKVHRETTSQGLRSITTPFLAVVLCCAVATLYSLGTGRKKLSHDENENTGHESGLAVQHVEYLETETVPEGEKVRLFEESETCPVEAG